MQSTDLQAKFFALSFPQDGKKKMMHLTNTQCLARVGLYILEKNPSTNVTSVKMINQNEVNHKAKSIFITGLFFLSALAIGIMINLVSKPEQIEYLDVMIKPNLSSLRDYSDETKRKTRIYCNGKYVTFDEYEDFHEAERAKLEKIDQ